MWLCRVRAGTHRGGGPHQGSLRAPFVGNAGSDPTSVEQPASRSRQRRRPRSRTVHSRCVTATLWAKGAPPEGVWEFVWGHPGRAKTSGRTEPWLLPLAHSRAVTDLALLVA